MSWWRRKNKFKKVFKGLKNEVLYPIMDFNQSFGSYDTIDGANCQPIYPEKKTQREAAIEAVKEIGLHQIQEIDEEIFENRREWKEMFFRRLEELKKYGS